MTNNIQTVKLKKSERAPDSLKLDIKQLIRLSGYNRGVNSELRDFANIGGGADNGISDTKIKRVLDEDRRPRENFLYALATIAAKVRGLDYYRNLKITDPVKYELERYLTLCDYGIEPGSIFPATPEFRRNPSIKSKQYLSVIPNIFCDLNIPFEDIVSLFAEQIGCAEQRVVLDDQSCVTFGSYNYVGNGNQGQLIPVSVEEESSPDVFRFRITNDNAELKFKSIEALRHLRNARMLMVLHNGSWIELTCVLEEYDGCNCLNLDVDNYYNPANLEEIDKFFRPIDKSFDDEYDLLRMGTLYERLATNPNYRKTYKQLSLGKQINY